MLKFAYATGMYQALVRLGLEKYAVMLPPPTAAAKAIGEQAGREGVQTALTSIAGGLAAKVSTPIMQHIRAMGVPQAGESATSQWFRNQLLSQASPQEMLSGAMVPGAGHSGGVATAGKVTPPASFAPTMPPPGR